MNNIYAYKKNLIEQREMVKTMKDGIDNMVDAKK